MEARTLMLASNNVLFPASGEPSIVPSQDVVLGLYQATRERINGKGEGMVFADLGECRSLDAGEVERAPKDEACALTEWAKNKATGEFEPATKLVETTVGRALLSEILPKRHAFLDHYNKTLREGKSQAHQHSFRKCGLKETVGVCRQAACKTASAWQRAPVSSIAIWRHAWCRLAKSRDHARPPNGSEGDRAGSLNVLQYFISTHGGNVKLADDGSWKTANSGYLTAPVDVTQDLVDYEKRCATQTAP
ncbi:hypothetical protein FQA39_LY19323 [Lamprigera yunnana]|nr:hypothetical protein FQA39_LY19323 [Lamprigera yunnana]